MGGLLYEKLAPTLAAFEKVGKIANSFKIPQSVSSSLEMFNECSKVNCAFEKLTEVNAVTSAYQSYLDISSGSKWHVSDVNKFDYAFPEAYHRYRNYLLNVTAPISEFGNKKPKEFITFKLPNNFIPKVNLNEPFIDSKISEVLAGIKNLDDKNFDSFIDISKSYNYRNILERLGLLVSNEILNYQSYSDNLLFTDAIPSEDEIREWKKRKREFLTNLLAKLLRIKKEIFKSVSIKIYKINRRECFRKIYCFLFKNLDDTDSVALISFAY